MFRWRWIAIAAILAAPVSLAQDVTGSWAGAMPKVSQGTLIPGSGKRLVVTLSKDRRGELKGAMVQLPGGEVTFALTRISLEGSKLSFGVDLPGGTSDFTGTLNGDGNSIDGWFQNLPLKLERTGRARKAKGPVNAAPAAPASSDAAPAPAATAESSAALARALAKLHGTGERLLRYTCLETIERSYYSETARTSPASCDGKTFNQDGRLRLDEEDRLRLEVATADGKEMHSWAAANRFDSRSVFEIIPNGPMSTGAFGSALVDIFENAGTRYSFPGSKSKGGRDIFEYAFEVPVEASHSRIQAGNGWITTGYRGSFEIDAASSDLVRVASETGQLAEETKMCRYRTATDYYYAQIGGGQFLVPRASEFDVLKANGDETRSVTTFSSCHEYAAESSVVFDEASPAAVQSAAPKAGNGSALAPGIALTLALIDGIDTRTAAAGDAVSAKVTKAARAPGSNQILVDAGAVVHGRITQMQHQYLVSRFLIAIRFETLEQRGAVSPVAIELERQLKAEPAPDESGSWFAVPAASEDHAMKAGAESKWITVAK